MNSFTRSNLAALCNDMDVNGAFASDGEKLVNDGDYFIMGTGEVFTAYREIIPSKTLNKARFYKSNYFDFKFGNITQITGNSVDILPYLHKSFLAHNRHLTKEETEKLNQQLDSKDDIDLTHDIMEYAD